MPIRQLRMPTRRQRAGRDASSARDSRRQARATRGREEAARRRGLERRHTVIVVVGAVAAMAVVGASFGLVPAIAAARGQGMTGSFVIGYQTCSARYGCTWIGTFEARNGLEIPRVAYEGSLPAGAGPGQSIPARYPGGASQVYALHGSRTWLMDLLLVIGAGFAVAVALWISPLGTRHR